MIEEVTIGYMDKVDFDEELGQAIDGNKVYPSVEMLERFQPCTRQCGIVKVEVRLVEVVRETEYDFKKMPRGRPNPEEQEHRRKRGEAIRAINEEILALHRKKHQIRRGEIEP